ncbi:NUDIX hydrolase [Humidisolicoccus flavus]|uniref:NUDIX hydrolase n=1 Tax=Humidisolicoccus flavus TaxID=3111414 RepID=UPI00324A6370
MTDSQPHGLRVRRTARVVLLDPEDRVLLFFTHWDNRIAPPRWLTVGGGIEPGESAREGAARELFEETGLRVPEASLGTPIWQEVRDLPSGHSFDRVDSTYFLARTATFRPSNASWEPSELEDILDARWWSLEAIDSSSDNFDPENVRDILARVTSPGEARSE